VNQQARLRQLYKLVSTSVQYSRWLPDGVRYYEDAPLNDELKQQLLDIERDLLDILNGEEYCESDWN
jgi:hypothetical protein